MGKGYFIPEGTKDCLWIERRQMWPIGKWQFIKVSQRGLLIAGLQYFDSWTLVVSLRRRNKAEGMGEKGKACQSHVCHAQAN
ncbi:hypothetical protein T4B_1446 [Trichinella pseudospiralis]|uniref:Uncharacterized protein n=1 Tax=Trichinella pseudospiralis TaxID=6337 RepID=A0A0V1GF00_TRIPS|nr:hypothetical protein T4B_1446 [Trichinella pseudospiralis]